jgi:hypothetical protein
MQYVSVLPVLTGIREAFSLTKFVHNCKRFYFQFSQQTKSNFLFIFSEKSQETAFSQAFHQFIYEKENTKKNKLNKIIIIH